MADPSLFAVLSVGDYARGRAWYTRLFGSDPAFEAHETECVWEIADGRFVAVKQDARRAGTGEVTVFVADLDAAIDGADARGIEPMSLETYANGVRKAVFADPDGNEIGYGGEPLDPAS